MTEQGSPPAQGRGLKLLLDILIFIGPPAAIIALYAAIGYAVKDMPPWHPQDHGVIHEHR